MGKDPMTNTVDRATTLTVRAPVSLNAPMSGATVSVLPSKQAAATGAMKIPMARSAAGIARDEINGVSYLGVSTWSPRSSASTTQLLDERLAVVVKEFEALVKTEAPDWPRPTQYALSNAVRVLAAAYIEIRLENAQCYWSITEPVLATDSVGGIRVTWRRDSRELRANFGAGPELRTYLYFESEGGHGIRELRSETLCERLQWLTAQ